MTSRFTVGIDLGTTNCAVAVRDTSGPDVQGRSDVIGIPQLVNATEVAARPLLPSFLYIPGPIDFPPGSTALPWDPAPRFIVGELARKRGAEAAVRLVASAKSWLSYGGARRTAPILPWEAPPEVERLSPVEASAAYLRHLREAFDLTIAGGDRSLRLSDQDVYVTIPASFDEEARELTLRAAASAGLEHVTLLEEPQAAFYAWLDAQGDAWRSRVRVGDLILVCDIGGGTTDFTLITVSDLAGDLQLERVAVGDHILLGGDNMDLALARLLQQRLEASGPRLDTWQLHALWHQCRLGKEALLGAPGLGEHPVTLLGRGSRLIGGTTSIPLTREDVDRVLLDGFFPPVPRDRMPARQRRVGLQEIGLPYAADPAVTTHLARFLARQTAGEMTAPVRRGRDGMACPTHVLFNGGVMKSSALQERLGAVLNSWLSEDGFDPVTVLDAPDLDHAVARGAAYYGLARRGRGIRIRSGASRTYYIGIESAMPAVPGVPAPLKALCVVPFGMEEGTSVSLADREFGLVVGEPAQFRFLTSTVRKNDPPGALIEDWGEDIEELGPLDVTLQVPGREDDVVPVVLESHVTELGTLELWCVARDRSHRWKLELNIRE